MSKKKSLKNKFKIIFYDAHGVDGNIIEKPLEIMKQSFFVCRGKNILFS